MSAIELPRNEREVLRIETRTNRGFTFVDIRVWSRAGKEDLAPTGMGVLLPIEEAANVLAALRCVAGLEEPRDARLH